jgi:RNA polymerase sigma factor (sigma-70 family)
MDSPRLPDETLMAQVQAGDTSAYRELYERWRKPVFSFLVRRTCALALAEEAHQETWLRVYHHRHRYDSDLPFRPWLYTIAANAGRDARWPDASSLTLDPAVSEEPGLRDLLVSALHCLDGLDRRILLLVVEGFTASEIGVMIGIGDGGVRMRLSRARARIREVIDV